jgi:5-methylcytosine-specific restriction endonuclease McrA
MKYDNDRLNAIYDKTDGYCHLCHKKLSFTNHGVHGAKGSWHVEHSVPKAKGGTDHLNNLFPACIKCNFEKSTYHTKTVRGWNGNTRAPHSKAKKTQIRKNNTAGGAIVGGGIGLIIGGPIGGAIGSFIGGALGHSNSPKK